MICYEVTPYDDAYTSLIGLLGPIICNNAGIRNGSIFGNVPNVWFAKEETCICTFHKFLYHCDNLPRSLLIPNDHILFVVSFTINCSYEWTLPVLGTMTEFA